MLIFALLAATATISAVLGHLFARHRSESRNRHHSDERNRLGTELRLAEEQRDQARTQAETLRRERDEAQSAQREREIAATEQNARLEAASGRIGALEVELDALRGQNQRAATDAGGLRKSLDESRQRLRDLEGELTTAERDKAALEAVADQRKELIDEHKAVIEKLRTERAGLEKRQAEVTAIQKELDQAREKHSRLQSDQIKSVVAEMLSTSQEKLAATANESLGGAAKAVTEKLQELGVQLREVDGKRASTEARLDEQIKNLAKESLESRKQTASLVQALRKSHVRGQWGELQLKRAVEMANLRERCDFDLQVVVKEDGKVLRPDMVVNLTGDRRVVVDAKVSLDAFMSALEATEETERDRLMGEHTRQVRAHVDGLAAKKYHDKVEGSADFVLMFLPSEALLQAAMNQDAGLYEYALDKRVVIASPTVLVSMLRTIALSWNEKMMQENTEKIRKLGREVYERLATLSDHLGNLGHHIDKTVEFYDKTIGSLEGRILKPARDFTKLGIQSNKKLAERKPVERQTRALVAPELVRAVTTEPVVPAVGTARPETEQLN
ncbi:DNA recombination protein RmuC [Nocardiopsis sp. CT-R113]|uniref:DNA recombination protein RmuC n=1 Tax=Nocardiopsis codii TaxID=3065942 RepID=A0ABU7K0K5_9ACTN|nr:DNA recombination protein RmuC [Nocardiopsis sp. CT-R113]MEE2035777.1 DNA recombination protein RmuC [Nocardiopsis sp. CT-R113]